MKEIYIVYGITDCPACLRACADLMERDKEFVFVETDFSKTYRSALKEEFDWPTFPMLVKVFGDEEEFIGGYDEMKALFSVDPAPT
jgi:glutaredoxin-related protein|tara:strand:- start:1789 stop:2046 length:258 start_codon:yes stop_codon:yes gene_type:complete